VLFGWLRRVLRTMTLHEWSVVCQQLETQWS